MNYNQSRFASEIRRVISITLLIFVPIKSVYILSAAGKQFSILYMSLKTGITYCGVIVFNPKGRLSAMDLSVAIGTRTYREGKWLPCTGNGLLS